MGMELDLRDVEVQWPATSLPSLLLPRTSWSSGRSVKLSFESGGDDLRGFCASGASAKLIIPSCSFIVASQVE